MVLFNILHFPICLFKHKAGDMELAANFEAYVILLNFGLLKTCIQVLSSFYSKYFSFTLVANKY